MSLATQINFRTLSKLVIDNVANDRALLRTLAYEEVKDDFDSAIERAYNEFQQHVVTQELKEATNDPENTPNYSSTLIDSSGGNLFTFIGFQRGQDPTAPIEQEFQKAHLRDVPMVTYVGPKRIRLVFSAILPSLSDIEAGTPVPRGPVLGAENAGTSLPTGGGAVTGGVVLVERG